MTRDALLKALDGYRADHPDWLTDAEDGCPTSVVLRLAIEAALRASAEAAPELDDIARAYIHVRGAHNPTVDEMEGEQEVRPCAWCRLAAEQHVEVVARLAAAPEDEGS